MSLINKMLQDLDARGGQPSPAAASPEIKPVPARERSFRWLRSALLVGLIGVLGASAYVAWRIQQTSAVEVQVEAGPTSTLRAPSASSPQELVLAEAPAAGAAGADRALVPAAASAPEAPALAAEPAPAVAEPLPAPKPAPTAVSKLDNAPVRAETPAGKPEPGKAPPAVAAVRAPTRQRATPASPAPAKLPPGRVETPAQRAENGYRRALASLEDGRVTEAIAHLEAALRAEPRHEASRQTLVSLLIEAKRPEEAIRQLGVGLALDPRQPAMAMLMARLQIERGSPGIDTLMRSLPYAAGNGEYHAFLAGVLQREERHREAVDHYTAALRTAPQNGVWWMGLGMSLQAEQRSLEAAGAFQKALDSGTLSAELQGFVERKLKQLAR